MKYIRKQKPNRNALLHGIPGIISNPIAKTFNKSAKALDWRVQGRKLTKVFNRYIRLRDTVDEISDENRSGRCISCGREFWFEQLDAGHFIGSQHLGTKWCEKNVHAQCRKCNRFEEGQKADYAEALKKKYGSDILDLLKIQKKLFAKHPDIFVIQKRIEEYTAKCKEIEG